MKTKFILVLSVAFLLTAKAFAGDYVGNGGDAMRCGVRYLFYDLFELERVDGSTGVFNGKGTFEIAHDLIARQSNVDAQFKQVLLEYLEDFRKNYYTVGGKLYEIDDNPGWRKMHKCRKFQAAINRHDSVKGRWRYVISGEIWGMLNIQNRASLVLHEILYRYAYLLGHRNASAVKNINKFMMANPGYQKDSCHLLSYRQLQNMIRPGEVAWVKGELIDVYRVRVNHLCEYRRLESAD